MKIALYLAIAVFFISLGTPLKSHGEPASSDKADPIENKPTNSPPQKPPTSATNNLAHIIQSKSGDSIEGLTLPQTQLPVVMVQNKKNFRPMVEIPLTYNRKGWSLWIQGKTPVTPTTEEGKFKVFAYLKGKVNELHLVARGPQGETQSERIYLYSPEAQEFSVVSPWDAVKLTLGSTYLIYQQSGYTDFYSWSGLLSAQIHSPEEGARFGMIGQVSMTALTISSNQKGYGPQIGQGNIDGIYFFPWSLSSRWRNQIMGGLYYVTMFSNGAPFGFKNLFAPEFGFRTRYLLNEKSDFISEFRFMPLNSSTDLNERGYSLSFSKSWILPNLHRGEVGLQFNDLRYSASPTDLINMKALSVIFSYSL
ncbi:MAG: hypothetical protein ACM3MG_12860 [Bacillota bacterium]